MALLLHHLRYVAIVDVDFRERSAVGVLAVGDDQHRPFVEQQVQPLRRFEPSRFRRFRRVDALDPDPFGAMSKGIAVDEPNLPALQQSCALRLRQ